MSTTRKLHVTSITLPPGLTPFGPAVSSRFEAVSTPRTKHPVLGPAPDKAAQARAKILSAFSERAKRSGIRSVVMGDLASDLRMSMSTLYDHFPSKEQLVAAMVDHWYADLAAQDAIIADRGRPAVERFMTWAEAWSGRVIQYSPPFWADLSRDYPIQWQRLQHDLEERRLTGAKLLEPHLRPGLTPAAAFALLDIIYTRSHDPQLCDRLGISRRDAIRTALSIWAQGALVGPRSRRTRGS